MGLVEQQVAARLTRTLSAWEEKAQAEKAAAEEKTCPACKGSGKVAASYK